MDNSEKTAPHYEEHKAATIRHDKQYGRDKGSESGFCLRLKLQSDFVFYMRSYERMHGMGTVCNDLECLITGQGEREIFRVNFRNFKN